MLVWLELTSMNRTRVKICCITSAEEAALAIACGADALGLVGSMPSGPGVIDDHLIRSIADTVPPAVSTFLLTSETTPDAIIDHARRCGTDTIQIVGHVDPKAYDVIRDALPNVRLVQVIHVQGEETVAAASWIADSVDAILLDSGRPSAEVKELGGTGRTHDWSVSRQIVEEVPCPVFLAGGLTAQNVREAIETVRPFGVDLCSGVRSNDRLDESKLRLFFEPVYETCSDSAATGSGED